MTTFPLYRPLILHISERSELEDQLDKAVAELLGDASDQQCGRSWSHAIRLKSSVLPSMPMYLSGWFVRLNPVWFSYTRRTARGDIAGPFAERLP